MEQGQRDMLNDELDGVKMNTSLDESRDKVDVMVFGEDQSPLIPSPIIGNNNMTNSQS